MLVYFIKSAACMAIFLLFYKLLLEKENMHVFKRFYLLGALVTSLVIPSLVFVEYVEPLVVNTPITPTIGTYTSIEIEQTPAPSDMDMINFSLLFAMLYSLGVLVFGIRFFKNLFQIINRIRKNIKLKIGVITKVLLQEKMAPHTFFKYVFLNKSKFESNTIPKEVLLHEETHAKQRHSLDVIFVELLQVVLWFNPLIYFFKKSIKLNHEFLADQAVIKKEIDKTTYQNTLLSYLSPDSAQKYQPQLANAINYSSIKKRFTIMKTHTSKKAILLRSLLLLPLLAVLIYGFSQKTTETIQKNSTELFVITDIKIDIDEIGNLSLNNSPVEMEDIYEKVARFNSQLTRGQIKSYVSAYIFYSQKQLDLIDQVQSELQKSGIRQIEHISKNTTKILNNTNLKESAYNGKTIEEARTLLRKKVLQDTPTDFPEGIQITIKNQNEIWIDGKRITLKDLANKVSRLHDKLGMGRKPAIEIFSPDILHANFLDQINRELEKINPSTITIYSEEYIMPENEYKEEIDVDSGTIKLTTNKVTLVSPFENATPKQIARYNELARKYNVIPIEKRKIPLSDLKILETVFRVMNVEQKQNAQPFPECLPQNTQDGASRKLMAEYNALAKKYNTMLSTSKSIQIKKKDVDRLEHIYGLMSEKQKADAESFPEFPPMPKAPKAPKAAKAPKVKKGEKSDIPPPPPAAPEPVEPIDHVVEMAKKDATFYYEGEEVSSDTAIELIRDNLNLNIQITGEDSNTPKVKISKSPIRLKKSKAPKSLETGNIEINGKEGFYSIRNGVTSYFNYEGEQVDKNGNLLGQSSKKSPKIYYNGKQISSVKANRLLSSNKSIQVGSKGYDNGGYAIVLTDLNSSFNESVNKTNNPNSVIDLTDMIAKNALFFYNNNPITVEKALWLTQNNHIERVNTIEPKKGKPKVYFWDKA